MTLRAALTMTVLAATTCAAAPALHDAYSAAKAYAYTKQVTAFGYRPPGTPGHQKTEDLINSVLKADGALIEHDNFTAKTPRGMIEVHNIIGKFNVNAADPNQPIVILAGHYDTLFMKDFVGANDGGSSTGIVLAFADALKGQKTNMQIWLMWTDLEEAIQSFQGDDGLYGSRHYAQKLKADGLVPRIRGFFLLDMIGDTDLNVSQEQESNPALQAIIAKAADELGYTKYFFQSRSDIIDDHKSFIDVGIPSVDVVDAEFGRMGPGFDGMGEFHHSTKDTIDKVSQNSLEIVGRTILRAVELMDSK